MMKRSNEQPSDSGIAQGGNIAAPVPTNAREAMALQHVEDALKDAPLLLTFGWIAKLTGVSERTWRRRVEKGKLLTVGSQHGHPRIPRTEFKRFLWEDAIKG